MIDDEHESNDETLYSQSTLISISQANHFAAMVAEGKFASIDDAIENASQQLQLVRVGNDVFSAEAIERLLEGIRQADRGELMSAEEVDRKFGEFFGRLNARKPDDPRG